MALEMVAAHNSMIRGINAIVLQAPNVHSLPDVADLLYLCQIWTISIGHHHTVEERFLFPQVEALSGKPELMAENAEQHRAFHDGLEAFATYAKETKPEAYRWEDMKAVIDAFMPPLYEHLRDEIPTILALRELDSGELKKIWKTLEDHAKGDSERHPQMQVRPSCEWAFSVGSMGILIDGRILYAAW